MQGLRRDRRSWRAEIRFGEGAPRPQAFLGTSHLSLPLSEVSEVTGEVTE